MQVIKIIPKTETPVVEGTLNYSPFLRQHYDNTIMVDAKSVTFNKVTGDIAIPLDDAAKDTLKVLADSITETDQVFVDMTKILGDSFTQSDSINTIGATLVKQEFINNTEQLIFNVTRVLETYTAVSDTPYISATKVVTDSQSVTEYKDLTFILGLITDSIYVVDDFVGYQFQDNEVDAIITNPIGIEDDPEVTTSKVLTDVTDTPTDSINTIDINKVLTDTPIATEYFTRVFNAYKYIDDSTNVTETWFIQTPNSYVDQTYFSEFYVGDIIRSF